MSHHVSLHELAKLVKSRREKLGLSSRALGRLAGIDDSNIVRLEKGNQTPTPENLAKLSRALELPLADLYHLAGYEVPGELPSPPIYFRTKYKHLPDEAHKELDKYIKDLQKRYPESGKGPEPGEDE
jgi:transcriptional regulator with XRE-family HTH domain